MRAPLPYESKACLSFMRLPWPGGLSSLCWPFCHLFLTSCGVDELLGLRSLYLTFSLSWVLLGHRLFLLQSSPCLLCGLADTSATPPHSLLLSSCSPVLLLGLFSYYFGLPWPILFLWASSACFIILGILNPF